MEFGGAHMDDFDDPAKFLLIVSALRMTLLNAHNILSLAFTIPIEAPSLVEFLMDIPEGVWHMDNIHHASIAVLHSFQ